MAALLRTDANTDGQWASLVPIQPHGTKPPLFLVHGAGGNVLLYRYLAKHLAPDYPLYGLQSRGLDGQTDPLETIEEMAEHYLREIRTVKPTGPYFLGGYCMGGTVAYEMAQRLSRDGEHVGLLALLDTYNYVRASKARFGSFLFEKAKFHMFNVFQLRPREMVRYATEKLRIARDGEWRSLGAFRRGPSEPNVTRAETGAELSVQALNDQAADSYVPYPYPRRLTLFKPRINYKFYPDPTMGWREVAQGGLSIVELAMHPHAMLLEPFVSVLAEELKAQMIRSSRQIVGVLPAGTDTESAQGSVEGG